MVTGWTYSSNFPVHNAFQSRLSGVRDAFVTKLNPSGTALIYSTYLGGPGLESGNAIGVDGSGNAVVAGDTTSTNLPVTAGVSQQRSGGGQDGFVAKFPPAGLPLTALTYLGGNARTTSNAYS